MIGIIRAHGEKKKFAILTPSTRRKCLSGTFQKTKTKRLPRSHDIDTQGTRQLSRLDEASEAGGPPKAQLRLILEHWPFCCIMLSPRHGLSKATSLTHSITTNGTMLAFYDSNSIPFVCTVTGIQSNTVRPGPSYVLWNLVAALLFGYYLSMIHRYGSNLKNVTKYHACILWYL